MTIGSNVFNLAALLGLGAVAASQDQAASESRRPRGTVALVIAGICLLAGPGS